MKKKHLTLNLDNELRKKLKIKAVNENTTVSKLVEEWIKKEIKN